MDPSPGAWIDWLRGAGVPFAVDDALARDPDFDGPLVLGDEPLRSLVLRIGEGGEQEDLPPVVEHRDPAAGLTADHATQSVAREMVRRPHVEPMRPLWEIGCGTGVLASLGGLLGAVPILGTDVDPRAIALARRTSSDTGVEVEWHQGSLLDPIDPGEEAHLVIANLPHKPCADRSLPLSQDGGPEGDRVFAAFAAQAARRLPAGARVLFFLHSLPHPRLLGNLSRDFDLRLLSWKRRFLAPGEYGPLAEVFRARCRAGTSWMGEEGGREFLAAGVWSADRRGG